MGSPWQTDLTFRTFKLLGWRIMCLTVVVVLFASWITNSCMLYEIGASFFNANFLANLYISNPAGVAS